MTGFLKKLFGGKVPGTPDEGSPWPTPPGADAPPADAAGKPPAAGAAPDGAPAAPAPAGAPPSPAPAAAPAGKAPPLKAPAAPGAKPPAAPAAQPAAAPAADASKPCGPAAPEAAAGKGPQAAKQLQIRPEQMAALSDPAREAYIKRTHENLIKLFPDDPRVKDEKAMRVTIEDGIERAGKYGIRRQREVSLFIFLLHESGPDFERKGRNRWMERILRDEHLEDQEKMDLIYKRLSISAGKT
jgi:hypothetical protein